MLDVDEAQRSLIHYRLEEAGCLGLHVSHRLVEATNLCVLGLHGYSEHGARYAHFANFLAERKAESFWMDLPGHGRSEGRRADIGSVDEYVDAFHRFYKDVRAKRSQSRFHIFAHSLGGLVALRWLQTCDHDLGVLSLSLSSPLLGLQRFDGWRMSILWSLATLLPNFTLPNESELGASHLTHDIEMEKSRRADPLIKPQVTIHWVRAFLRARRKVFQDINRLKLPIGIFQAGEEMVTHRGEAQRFYQLLSTPSKEWKVYPSAYHEILNETNRAEIMLDIWNWMSAHEPRHF